MGTRKLTNYPKNSKTRFPNLDYCLLLVWIVLGGLVRFAYLGTKPPWADEWATLVFSLGNSFLSIPLDRVIDFATLMAPLQVPEVISLGGVVSNLLAESTHPPVYFALTHLWLGLLSAGGMVSVALARSLSVVFGILGIPAIFYLAKLLTNSPLCAQLAAILMAFSPYGVYLAQETRHYTFAILLIVASVACLGITFRKLQTAQVIPYPLVFSWIVINCLGVATHYFLALALVTQVLLLANILVQDLKKGDFTNEFNRRWQRITIAILGTFAGCSIWLWTWLQIPDNQLTDWTKHGNPSGWGFLIPVGRICGWLTTMVLLLPIEGVPTWVIVISAIIVLALVVWLMIWGFRYWQETDASLTKQIAFSYVAIAWGLILAIAYFGDRDLTLAARFQFFYFPLAIVAISAILAFCWQKKQSLVLLVITIAICGSLTVVTNYGYQKPDRADLVVPVVAEAQSLQPDIPVLMAIVHKHHEQTGEMMSIAWEWLRKIDPQVPQPKLIMLHKKPDTPEQNITRKFAQQLATLPRPLNVWVLNFSAPTGLENQGCEADLDYKRRVAGYRFRLYHCT